MNALLHDQLDTHLGLETQYRDTLCQMAARTTDAAVKGELEVAIRDTTRYLERLGRALVSFDCMLDCGSCRCGKCLAAVGKVGLGIDGGRRGHDAMDAVI